MENSCNKLYRLTILLSLTLTVAVQCTDPCWRYTEISDERRSIRVISSNIFSFINDSNLVHSWYRFIGGAGDTIPTTCPGVGKCSTPNPIYMVPNNEMYIARADGSLHEREVCSAAFNNCRLRCFNIQVKNCTNFLVYKLPPSPPNAAYCAGNKERCPDDETSISGFKPCTRASRPQPPSIELVEDDPENVYLDCVLQAADTTLQHHVQWMADGNVFLRETLPPGQTRARLNESQMQNGDRTVIGYHISCAVSGSKVGENIATPFTSTEGRGVFLGLEIVDADGNEIREIVLDEDDLEPTFLYVRSTIPVRCNSPGYLNLPSVLRPPCELTVAVVSGDLQEIDDLMRMDCDREGMLAQTLMRQVEFGVCIIRLTEDNRKNYSQHRIPVFSVQDNIPDGRQIRYVNLTVQANFQRLWDNYPPSSVKVVVDDTKIPNVGSKTCSLYTGAHITTFDGLEYEHVNFGEFVLYENPARNIRVHVYSIQCMAQQASCTCGIAAQAGDDVILLDRCSRLEDIVFDDLPPEARERGYLRQKVFARGDMTPGFTLEHDEGSNAYKIKFPHGAELRITLLGEETEHINLRLTPSHADYAQNGRPQKVRGLCGTFSMDQREDLLLPNGTIYEPQNSDWMNGRRFVPTTFSEGWRVPEVRSLYNGRIFDSSVYYAQLKCGCLPHEDPGIVLCRVSTCVDQDLTDLLLSHGADGRRKRALDNDHVTNENNFRFDPAPQEARVPEVHWGRTGWTKRQAREYCTRLITNAAFYQECRDVSGIDFSSDIETCVYDIGLIKSPAFAEDMLERAQSKCEETLQQMLQPVNSFCPQACMGRGRCTSGRCQCDAGWTGLSCSFRRKPPTIYYIPSDGLCDQLTRSCRTTTVLGDNFIPSEKLRCIFISLETSEEVMTSPKVESYMKIYCPVPAVENYARFKLRISNDYLDENMNSAAVMFTVYRSDCVVCTNNDCSILPQGCA